MQMVGKAGQKGWKPAGYGGAMHTAVPMVSQPVLIDPSWGECTEFGSCCFFSTAVVVSKMVLVTESSPFLGSEPKVSP